MVAARRDDRERREASSRITTGRWQMIAQHRIAAGVGEVTLTVSAISHIGKVRRVNEDAFLAEPPLFAVADGMGGHAFGDLASAAAVRALHDDVDLARSPEPGDVLTAIGRANDAVRALAASAGDERLIAGTTLAGVALVVEHPEAIPRWMVFNLGDSRVYRWEGSASTSATALGPRLMRVSVDHSVVQEMQDAGLIDEKTARTHPDRNVVIRALGASPEVAVEAWLLPASQPQTFLICSDGLTKELDDERIAVLIAAGDVSSAADRLMEAALDAGGHDNVTIVLVHAEYRGVLSATAQAGEHGDEQIDEQTSDRALSPELEDTLPRF